MSTVSKILAALFSGLLFGLGLMLSGMTDPANVLGFLDVFGAWNPRLAFVMAGALISLALLRLVIRPPKSAGLAHTSSPTSIDSHLITGSILFGIGWGLSGLCPGPALVGIGMGIGKIAVFVLSMFTGFLIYHLLSNRSGKSGFGL
ncbi:MAG: DUF6691 family protein [Methyloprofundus sp.]|nr:DUF6691 family protein [Methyloprofundus sp.]